MATTLFRDHLIKNVYCLAINMQIGSDRTGNWGENHIHTQFFLPAANKNMKMNKINSLRMFDFVFM